MTHGSQGGPAHTLGGNRTQRAPSEPPNVPLGPGAQKPRIVPKGIKFRSPLKESIWHLRMDPGGAQGPHARCHLGPYGPTPKAVLWSIEPKTDQEGFMGPHGLPWGRMWSHEALWDPAVAIINSPGFMNLNLSSSRDFSSNAFRKEKSMWREGGIVLVDPFYHYDQIAGLRGQ